MERRSRNTLINVHDEEISFLWYRSQRDVHLYCKYRMTFT